MKEKAFIFVLFLISASLFVYSIIEFSELSFEGLEGWPELWSALLLLILSTTFLGAALQLLYQYRKHGNLSRKNSPNIDFYPLKLVFLIISIFFVAASSLGVGMLSALTISEPNVFYKNALGALSIFFLLLAVFYSPQKSKHTKNGHHYEKESPVDP